MKVENFFPSGGLCSLLGMWCQSERLLLPYLPSQRDCKNLPCSFDLITTHIWTQQNTKHIPPPLILPAGKKDAPFIIRHMHQVATNVQGAVECKSYLRFTRLSPCCFLNLNVLCIRWQSWLYFYEPPLPCAHNMLPTDRNFMVVNFYTKGNTRCLRPKC